MAFWCVPRCTAGARVGAGRTSKNGQDGLMDGLNFARSQYVAGEEGDYEQDDEDGESP